MVSGVVPTMPAIPHIVKLLTVFRCFAPLIGEKPSLLLPGSQVSYIGPGFSISFPCDPALPLPHYVPGDGSF